MSPPTIVLVHGAWADGSSWNRVSVQLRDLGSTLSMVSQPQVSVDAILAAVASLEGA